MTVPFVTSGESNILEAIGCLAALSVDLLRCFRIDTDSRRLVSIKPSQLGKALEENRKEIWIDIQASEPTHCKEFLEKLELHPLIIDDCLDIFRSSRFSSFEESLHFEFPIYAADSVEKYMSVICVPHLLITIRNTKIHAIDDLLESLESHARLNEGSKSAILYSILDVLGDSLIQVARNARNEVRQLSQTMDNDPDAVGVEKIISLKRRLQDITMIAEDQLYCIRALLTVDSKALQISNQTDYLRDAVHNYETALRVLHRYESQATGLHQQHVLSLQAKTEVRIRILTILSSICMPLTLIAGIYGMNFARMPETQWPWGYPATLIAMFLIAGGQIAFFYKRGWFG